MNIAVVSLYMAYPPICGAAAVTYNMAKHLNGEKYLIQLDTRNAEERLGDDIHLIRIRSRFRSPFFKPLEMFFNLLRIAKVVKRIDPDQLVLEGASWVYYYVVLAALLRIRNCRPFIIYHAHNVEYLLRKYKNGPLVVGITKWAERIMLETAHLATAVSEIDASIFRELYGRETVLLPNAVNVASFAAVTPEDILRVRGKYGLNGRIVLFMGLTAYKPNKEGIDFLIKEVFPLIVKIHKDVRLAIIGGIVGYREEWLINPGTIPFEDIPAFIAACDVCVAPIFSGSGTRLKILEYMAAGIPVVSTRKGAEGIAVDDGVNILIAENAAEFVNQIIALLRDDTERARVGRAGQKLVRESYDWETVVGKFVDELARRNPALFLNPLR